MARIPTYSELQVGANTLPDARVTAPDTSLIGGATAKQTESFGAALQQAGDVGARILSKEQEQADQLRVDEALNRIKEDQLRLTYDKNAGYTNIKGRSAFERPDGKSLADEYNERLKTSIDSVGADLGNDRQRQLFSLGAGRMSMSLRERITAHEAGEYKNYSLSVADGAVKTAVSEIGLNWQNPEVVANAAKRIEAETYRKSVLLGKSGEEAAADATQMVSHGHKVAIMSAIEQGNPAYAAEYFDRMVKAGQVTGDDAFAVRGHITREVNQQIGVKVANQTFSKFASSLQGTPMATIESITMSTESGGRRFGKDGNLLESPKGAKGEMQVLDGTNTNPGFGVSPAKDNSPDERARVGRDYLQAMLQRYGGDPAKMWAAYNAGPGKLDAALKAEAQAAKLAVNDPKAARSWIDYMPAETQAYVTKNLAALDKSQKSGVVVNKPTEQDLHQALSANPALANNPDAMKVAMAQVKQQYSDMEAATKQRGDEVEAAIQRALIENGGRWNDLSPTLRAQATQYIPGKVDNLKKFNGNPETDWGLYYDLKRDPQALAVANLEVMRDKLGNAEFKSLIEEQNDLRSGKLSSTTQLRSTHDFVQQLMVQSGLKPSSKDKGDAEKVGRVWSEIETRIQQQEKALGRKMTPNEAQTEVAKLFTNVEVHGRFWNSTTPAALISPKDAVVVPPKEYEKIAGLLKRQGKAVDDVTVANIYRRSLGAPAFEVN